MFLLYELMVALCMGLGICGALTGLAHYVQLERAHIMHHGNMLAAAQSLAGGIDAQRGPWLVQTTPYDVTYVWQGNHLVIAPVAQQNSSTVHKVTVSDVHGYTLFLLNPR